MTRLRFPYLHERPHLTRIFRNSAAPLLIASRSENQSLVSQKDTREVLTHLPVVS